MRPPRPSSHALGDASDHAATVRGLTLMVAAMLLLPTMDAIAKLVSASVAPGQVAFARFFFQALAILPVVVWLEGWRGLVPNRIAGNALRGLLLATASTAYFIGVKYLPLADALAIFFVEAIEKEEVGWRRRIAVVVGFIGALIVIRPSYQVFGPAALLPLTAALLFAFYLLLNRRLARHDSSLSMQFSAGVAGSAACAVYMLVGQAAGEANLTPSAGTPQAWALMVLVGVIAAGGHLMVIAAFRAAPVSLLAPFQYLEIVAATLLGYGLFGDFPDLWKWVGIAVICGSGVYVFWRESRLARPTRAEPPEV